MLSGYSLPRDIKTTKPQYLNMPTEASKEARSKELQAKAQVNLTAMPKLAYQLLTQNIVSFSVHVK